MSAAKTVSVDVEARSAGVTQGLDKAKADFKKFADEVVKEMEGIKPGKDFFNKGDFLMGDKSSMMKGVNEAKKSLTEGLSGGGLSSALVGVTALQVGLSSVADGARKAADGLKAGETTAQAFGGVVDGLPIVGAVKQWGEAMHDFVHEITTGEGWMRKMDEAAKEASRNWHEAARARSTIGKYGQEKQELDIGNQTKSEQENIKAEADKHRAEFRRLSDQIHADENSLMNRTFRNFNSGEIAQLQQARDAEQRIINSLQGKSGAAGDAGKQSARDSRYNAMVADTEKIRALNADVERAAAEGEEKSLKAQGKTLESRIVGVQTEARLRADALKSKLDPSQMRGMDDQRRMSLAEGTINATVEAEKSAAITIENLRTEDARRKEAIARENAEKLAEIDAQGNIARLKAQDEAANAQNERMGRSGRSHLAEQAAIAEEARKQAVAVQAKFADEHPGQHVVENDAYNREEAGLSEEHKDSLARIVVAENKYIDDLRKSESNTDNPAEKARISMLRKAAEAQYTSDLESEANSYQSKLQSLRQKYTVNTGAADFAGDANAKSQLAAVAAEKEMKLKGLGQEDKDATQKRDIEHAHELRRAWEELGTPAEKYRAKLDEINETYDKLGDANLKKKALQKLDADTLRSMEVDHTPHVNLYGRSDHRGIDLLTRGRDQASKDLQAIKHAAETAAASKKTAESLTEWAPMMQQIWQAVFMQQPAGGLSQYDITGV